MSNLPHRLGVVLVSFGLFCCGGSEGNDSEPDTNAAGDVAASGGAAGTSRPVADASAGGAREGGQGGRMGSGGAGAAGAAAAGGAGGGAGGNVSGGGGQSPKDAGGTDANPGTGGGHPVVVGPCDSLGAPGTWERITPSGVKNPQAMSMDPFDVGTLWLGASPRGSLGTGAGGVFKSTDCGATWTHMSTGVNGSAVDGASIWSFALDQVTPGVMYVIGMYGPTGLYKSTNGGVDWQQMLPAGGNVASVTSGGFSNPPLAAIGSVSMDPNDSLHLVLGTHVNCDAPYAPACGAESTDGGATWSLHRNSFMSGWAEATGPYVLSATSWLYANLTQGLWLTKDRGVTWKNVSPPGVGGVTGGEYTHRPIWRGKNGAYYLPATNKGGLLTSADGETWSLIAGSPSGSYELGVAVAGGRLFLGDRNDASYAVASEDAPTVWTSLPKSPAGAGEGAVFMEYDEVHHVLYSSNFEGGLWRMVTP